MDYIQKFASFIQPETFTLDENSKIQSITTIQEFVNENIDAELKKQNFEQNKLKIMDELFQFCKINNCNFSDLLNLEKMMNIINSKFQTFNESIFFNTRFAYFVDMCKKIGLGIQIGSIIVGIIASYLSTNPVVDQKIIAIVVTVHTFGLIISRLGLISEFLKKYIKL